jgi:hypothetical protein
MFLYPGTEIKFDVGFDARGLLGMWKIAIAACIHSTGFCYTFVPYGLLFVGVQVRIVVDSVSHQCFATLPPLRMWSHSHNFNHHSCAPAMMPSNHYHFECAPTSESPQPSPRFCPHCHLIHVDPNAATVLLPSLYCPHHHYWDREHAATAPSPHCCPNYHHIGCGHNVTQPAP